MTTFIKAKLKKSDYQTNIDEYRVAVNITEYNTTSKLLFLRIIIPKFMKIRQLFHEKNVSKISKNKHVLNWTYGLFGQNYRVATLSSFYLTVSGIIIPSLKSIKQF